MTATKTQTMQRTFPPAFGFACILCIVLLLSPRAESAVLPLGDEQDAWSDLSFPLTPGGSFDSGLLTIFTNVVPAELEIGSQFGPSNPGWHYGTGGTFGGAFSVSLSISRLFINPNGTLKNGDSIVTLSYKGGPPGSLGTDYGINTDRALLIGTVREVLLDAAGDNTLDILYTTTGGDLQLDHPDRAVGVYAPNNLGLFRISADNLPSNWASNFNLSNASVHAFGLVP